MSALFWRETACLKIVRAPTRSYAAAFFRSATFGSLSSVAGVPLSSAKHLFQACVSRRPLDLLQQTSKGHFWAPRTIANTVCRKCQHNKAGCSKRGRFSVWFASCRNFAVSSHLRQKAKDDIAKQALKTESKAAAVPKTSEVRRLLGISRPEKWRILGGN